MALLLLVLTTHLKFLRHTVLFWVFLILERIIMLFLNCERNIISLERSINNTNLSGLRLDPVWKKKSYNLSRLTLRKEKSPQGDYPSSLKLELLYENDWVLYPHETWTTRFTHRGITANFSEQEHSVPQKLPVDSVHPQNRYLTLLP